MPDLLQILCAHCNGNQILVTWRYLFLRESNNTTRYTSKLPNPRHRPCFATPRSGHITTPRPSSSLARQRGNITMPHPGNTLARYPDSTQAPRLSNTLALHRVNPPPRQIHPRSASSPQHPSAVSGALPRTRNKKSIRIATFLRFAIVASSPIANRGAKKQQKWHISSLKELRRAPNRKKVAKIPSFLFFCNGLDRRSQAAPAKTRGISWQADQTQKQEKRPLCGRLQKNQFG